MSSLKIDLYADGADINEMLKRYKDSTVKGFTTNPSLMAKSGIRDYVGFAKEVLKKIPDLPISFEVFSDEFDEMEKQALEIGSWGNNVYVKIPIMNTKAQGSMGLIRKLLDKGLKLNVTAICSQEQIEVLHKILKPEDDVIVSIFAGRIADTGLDPIPLMSGAVKKYSNLKKSRILWASPREVLNVYQAEDCGVHIITLTDALIDKLKLRGKSLQEFSLETVKMFYEDAKKCGFKI